MHTTNHTGFTPTADRQEIGTDDLLDIDDLTPAELEGLLGRAAALKAGANPRSVDAGTTLGLLFEKPSTRTRVSFETAVAHLDGTSTYLGCDELHLGHGEPLGDTALVLGRYLDGIVARLFDHGDLEVLANAAGCPVINGLTDLAHPCQTLADLLTIGEHVGSDATVAWVGDGNNVAGSFAIGAAMAGLDVTVATPPEFALDGAVLGRAAEFEGVVAVTDDPSEAVDGADVVYTDVWISMGEEDDRDRKLPAFAGFQVNEDLLAGTHAAVMHCLPATRGEEITDAVLTSDRSLVWDQAENRLHCQKALLESLLSG